jgi:hypothetical protein
MGVRLRDNRIVYRGWLSFAREQIGYSDSNILWIFGFRVISQAYLLQNRNAQKY